MVVLAGLCCLTRDCGSNDRPDIWNKIKNANIFLRPLPLRHLLSKSLRVKLIYYENFLKNLSFKVVFKPQTSVGLLRKCFPYPLFKAGIVYYIQTLNPQVKAFVRIVKTAHLNFQYHVLFSLAFQFSLIHNFLLCMPRLPNSLIRIFFLYLSSTKFQNCLVADDSFFRTYGISQLLN